MFSFLAKWGAGRPARAPITAHINTQTIEVQRDETLLHAALRQGIAFPHSCRVGGCATCKCKLVTGRVRELTETGYILSDDELDQGYILACQSVPQSDIAIELDLSSARALRQVAGRVIAQERLTHDITRLRVQLDQSLLYKAGQFAQLRLAALEGISRSYSFATPPRPDAQLSFFVRKVPGGVFSSLVHEQNVVGQAVQVEGPLGDFWLRPSDAPLLLVAGGSGLAPVLALLQQAVDSGCERSTTLLFGARERRDLYALDEIDAIARQWQGAFRFIPVLSAADRDAARDADWTGARGAVAEKIPDVLVPGAHAYLCGPPAMVDQATALLRTLGVGSAHIHADRFTTQQDKLPIAA